MYRICMTHFPLLIIVFKKFAFQTYNSYTFTPLNVFIIIHIMTWTGLVLIVDDMAVWKRHILHYSHLVTINHLLQVFLSVYWLIRLVLPAPQSLLAPLPSPIWRDDPGSPWPLLVAVFNDDTRWNEQLLFSSLHHLSCTTPHFYRQWLLSILPLFIVWIFSSIHCHSVFSFSFYIHQGSFFVFLSSLI